MLTRVTLTLTKSNLKWRGRTSELSFVQKLDGARVLRTLGAEPRLEIVLKIGTRREVNETQPHQLPVLRR